DANTFMDLEALAENFGLSRLGRAPARYDEAQLMHWQREAVLHLPSTALREWMGGDVHALVPADSLDGFIEAVRGNISFPADALRWARIVYTDKLVVSHAAREAMTAAGPEFFATAREALERHGADFRAVAEAVKQARSVSGKSLFQPLRAALLGELDGPEMAKLLPLMGAERALLRLERAISDF
ncbi:MAG TPA: hypothetical protein VLG93_05710, partial [Sulfuricaulis sp.]|nr:hypothetical protein [Sulfuricaulis sp.]